MRKYFRKYYLKIKSFIMSAIKGEKIIYLDGRDIPSLHTIVQCDGVEKHIG